MIVVVFGNFLCFFSSWWLFLVVVVGGEFGCGGGCWSVAWWWQVGHFHVVVLAMVGVWVCSWWRRERDEGGRKREKIRERIFFFGSIF